MFKTYFKEFYQKTKEYALRQIPLIKEHKKHIFQGLLILFCLIGVWGLYKKNTPTVSVVMSTYNRADLVGNATKSILNQTFRDFEFIIVNDGSTDNTAQVLRALAAKDKRIRIVTNRQNKGLVYSLNRGLKIARGKYIARMDDDDISLPKRFEKQVHFLDKHSGITAVGSQFVYASDKQKNIQEVNAPYDSLLVDKLKIQSYMQVPFLHPTAMIRSDFLKKHKIKYSPKFKSAEDTYFFYQITKAGGKFYTLPDVLLIYTFFSKKQDGFYNEQKDSFNQFLHLSLGSIIPPNVIRYPMSRAQSCYIRRQMLQQADLSAFEIDKNFLLGTLREDCRNIPPLYPLRGANRVFLEKRTPSQICIHGKESCGTLLKETNEVLHVKWDDGKDVLYSLQSDGAWTSADLIFVKHNHWKDFLEKRASNRLCRETAADCATVLSETPDKIILKWDRWGKETFIRQPNGEWIVSK